MGKLPEEMEQLLTELQTEGRLDSSGVFTLDFVKAADKLREFQLAEPHLYILKLIQSAVASEATAVSLVTSGTTLQLAFDGLGIEPHQLEGLVSCLLDPLKYSGQRQLAHLAVGLNSCLGCGVDQIIVESWRDGRGAALVLTEKLQQTGRVVGKARHTGTRLFLRKRGNPLLQLFRDELEAVTKRAIYSPIPVVANLSRVSHGRFGRPALPPLLQPFQPALKAVNKLSRFLTEGVMSQHRASLNTLGPDNNDPVMPWWVLIWNVEDYVFGQCHRNHHLVEKRWVAEPGPHTVSLTPSTASLAPLTERTRLHYSRAVALQADLQADARLQFVQDGVIVCELEEDMRLSGAVGLVSAEGLTTDASTLGIVANQAYRELLGELRNEFQELTSTLVARLSEDPALVPLGRHVLSRLKRRVG